MKLQLQADVEVLEKTLDFLLNQLDEIDPQTSRKEAKAHRKLIDRLSKVHGRLHSKLYPAKET